MTSWSWPSSIFTDIKYWTLAGHPSVLLRSEHKHSSGNGFEETTGWTITSSQVEKKIGYREFQCVEMKDRMKNSGDMDVHTTKYLSPDVPGHLVEMIKEFYKVGEPEAEPVIYMVTHQKVTALTLP